MAYTTPKTWTSGAVTAAEFNEQIRDNEVHLKAVLTTHGMTSDSSPTAVKSAGYGVSVTRSSQSVPDASDISMAYDTEEWDDAAFHSTVTNTQRITIPTDGGGRYEFVAQAEFESNSTGRRSLWLEKNGATSYNLVQTGAVSNGVTGLQTTVTLDLIATDYVRCMVRQNSGSSLNVTSRLQARRTSV